MVWIRPTKSKQYDTSNKMFSELKLSEIKARGWIKHYLETQARGLTGEIGNVGAPFSKPTWGDCQTTETQKEVFLGGVNSIDDRWVPFEQNGYWIDGAIRAGRLIDDEKLIELAQGKLYPAIESADEDGFIGPSFLKNGLSWPYAVYFRSLMAEYSASGDEKILEALKKHFLRRPLTEVYKREDLRIIAPRNVADIEIALWIYGQTKDERFLKMSENSYDEFNRRFVDDSKADANSEMRDITLVGMLGRRKVNRNHGVTYCEICKLAAILHYYTGKELYKKAAVNAFEKLYRDQMLVDGVASSTEYLNGNKDSWAAHETCVVSDLTWALGYLYMITGDPKYGDRVENAIFNAGLGCVDDDFRGQQYFSCPNQVIADDHSNHLKFFRGEDWLSFAPKSFLACCAGNVHRFMPNFVARAWMRDEEAIATFVYAPSRIELFVRGKRIVIDEETEYPFENTIRFRIQAEQPTAFTLVLRKPAWAIGARITINGVEYVSKPKAGLWKIERIYFDGDEIILTLEDKIELIENANGVSVKKGALLYALPVKEKVKFEGLRELGNPEFPHYSLYPESQWNYGLCVKESADFSFKKKPNGVEPWRREQNGLRIEVSARVIQDWKLKDVRSVQYRVLPRSKCVWRKQKATFTPKVARVTEGTAMGEAERIELVPYATTRLRIAIFPIICEE